MLSSEYCPGLAGPKGGSLPRGVVWDKEYGVAVRELPLLGLPGHRLVGGERLLCASLGLGRCYVPLSPPFLSY